MKNIIALLVAILLLIPAPAVFFDPAPAEAQDTDRAIKNAIVKIYTVYSTPDYFNPWRMFGPQEKTGSGAIIEGNRILTNAHVLQNHTFVRVRKYGEAKKYRAKVLYISHAADLALLTVEDPAFYQGVKPLTFGDLPNVQDQVLVLGYPVGGDTMSTTQGVVSRIEHRVYAHSSSYLLAAQIDAAINPGNSGGPVLRGGKIIGVVMQGYRNMDNIGYMVPIPVVKHFLKDVEDGKLDGIPALGVRFQHLENEALRKLYKVGAEHDGVLAIQVVDNSPAMGHIKAGDVLTAISEHPIADDATVEFRPGERTSFTYYLQSHQLGESLEVELLRDGIPHKVSIPISETTGDQEIIPVGNSEAMPSYYIFGGLVFCPVTQNLLETYGSDWVNKAPKKLVAMMSENYRSREREEIVIVLKVLADDVNVGYTSTGWWVVDAVNGNRIKSLKHLVSLVESSKDPLINFSNDNGTQVVLDREQALKAHAEILKAYRIERDRSEEIG